MGQWPIIAANVQPLCDDILVRMGIYLPHKHLPGGDGMVVFGMMVGIVSFAVNILLLLGTNRLLCGPGKFRSIVFGAAVGALHSAICTLSGFRFLNGFLWNLVFLLLSGCVAFGVSVASFGNCLLYILLSMALSWLTAGTGGGLWMGVAGAVGIFFLCARLMDQKQTGRDLLPVELHYNCERVCIWALRDSGNCLRDPISGNPVLVVGPKVAAKLFGLTQKQLENPVDSLPDLPGFRLIPFRTVGRENGMLLGMRLPMIRIGNWQGSSIVAFAPCGLGDGHTYQALTGGNI